MKCSYALLALLATSAPTFISASSSRSFKYSLTYNANYLPSIEQVIRQAHARLGFSPTQTNKEFFASHSTSSSSSKCSDDIEKRGLSSHSNVFHINSNDYIVDKGWGGIAVSSATNDEANNAWYITVGFGTPAQDINMMFDSGSSGLVVYDSTCSDCPLNNHSSFDTSKSSTFQVVDGLNFTIAYGDGTASSGYVGTDVVTVGNDDETLCVKDQEIELSTNSSGYGTDQGFDGYLGIMQDAGSVINGTGLFSNMIKQDVLDKPLIGIAFKKDKRTIWGPASADDPNTGLPGQGGEVSFGEINYEYVRGEITYLGVTSTTYWGTSIDAIYAGSKSVMDSSDTNRTIFDTGTTLIFLSTDTAANVHAQINGAYVDDEGVWYVPCDIGTLSYAPPIYFQFGGRKFAVPASDLAYKRSSSNDLCTSGIQGGSPYFNVMGDVFISNHYVVLEYRNGDLSDPYVGLANRRDLQLPTLF